MIFDVHVLLHGCPEVSLRVQRHTSGVGDDADTVYGSGEVCQIEKSMAGAAISEDAPQHGLRTEHGLGACQTLPESRHSRSFFLTMKPRIPPKLKRLPAVKQKRMDELLERNREGAITGAEKAKLRELVADAEHLMAENAKRVAAFHVR